MSTINCDSCANLREYTPEFVQNGVTDTIATSLKNNTGFNPALTVTHDNCEDLNDANDCLIGRMTDELSAYDVCEWQEFMAKLLPNQYELLKAIIAGACGQWNRLDSLCSITTQLIYPSVSTYAVRSPDFLSEHPDAVNVGHIYIKSGSPVVRPLTRAEHGPLGVYDPAAGIVFGWQEMDSCETGDRIALMQYCPFFNQYFSTSSLAQGDIVWYATRDELIAALGELPANTFVAGFIGTAGGRYPSSWSWPGGSYTGSNRKRWWWRMSIDLDGEVLGTGQDTVYIQYRGTDLPDPNAAPGENVDIMGQNYDSELRRLLVRV